MKKFVKYWFLWGIVLVLQGCVQTHEVRFAAIGDFGEAGEEEKNVAELVKSWDPDFIITLGDNNYPDGDASTIDANIGQYYHAYIAPYRGHYGRGADTNRLFPSLGNHDYHKSPTADPYLAYFQLPGNGRYYDFVKGSVHFFVLNSDVHEPDGVTEHSKQARWLKEKLKESNDPFNVVYFHHAPYSSGHHGPTKRMQWPFREWGASVVLSGHDHTYERLEVRGLPYIINGLGGKNLRYGFPKIYPGSRVRFNKEHGALLVEANEIFMCLRFYSEDGDLIDTLKLQARS